MDNGTQTKFDRFSCSLIVPYGQCREERCFCCSWNHLCSKEEDRHKTWWRKLLGRLNQEAYHIYSSWPLSEFLLATIDYSSQKLSSSTSQKNLICLKRLGCLDSRTQIVSVTYSHLMSQHWLCSNTGGGYLCSHKLVLNSSIFVFGKYVKFFLAQIQIWLLYKNIGYVPILSPIRYLHLPKQNTMKWAY